MCFWGYILSYSLWLSAVKSLQSCPTLCDPIDVSPPGSPVPGILQARTLEWVAISFSNAWNWKSEKEVAQSRPTLSDPLDYSPPGSSIHGIFQARVLEWSAIAFSREAPYSVKLSLISSLFWAFYDFDCVISLFIYFFFCLKITQECAFIWRRK